tara:strand:- start:247 stop:891 length:645 start_codon:yes stop_codon:yes gene_type:complete
MNITNVQNINFKASPITIYSTDFFIPTDKIEDFKKICSYNNPPKGTITLSQNLNILQHENLKDLNKLFNKVSDHYSKEVLSLKNNFVMTSSWSSLSKKGDYHHLHNHPNIVFSLIYYVTDNNSELLVGATKSAIQENLNFDYYVDKRNVYNSSSWTIKPKKGDMIAILGDLVHRTMPHVGDNDRMIVGANYFLDGYIGTDNDIYSSFKIKTSGI